jgi:hypothetical protein
VCHQTWKSLLLTMTVVFQVFCSQFFQIKNLMQTDSSPKPIHRGSKQVRAVCRAPPPWRVYGMPVSCIEFCLRLPAYEHSHKYSSMNSDFQWEFYSLISLQNTHQVSFLQRSELQKLMGELFFECDRRKT